MMENKEDQKTIWNLKNLRKETNDGMTIIDDDRASPIIAKSPMKASKIYLHENPSEKDSSNISFVTVSPV